MGVCLSRLGPSSAGGERGAQQSVDDRVGQRLPRRLDDVLGNADGRPRPLAVGGVEQHARHPALGNVHLTDYKVRVLDTHRGTGAITRVLIDSTDGEQSWTTIGVGENIIEASWQALEDSLVFGLLRAEQRG